LKCDLEAATAEFSGVLGVSVKDIFSGDEFYLKDGEIFTIGSSIKIQILIEFFRKAKADIVNLDETITVHEKDKTKGRGILKELGNRTVSMTLLDLATLMIIVRDNTVNNILLDEIKMTDVNAMIKGLWLKETKLLRKMLGYFAASKGLENLFT
jgi:beta-lactamase class A